MLILVLVGLYLFVGALLISPSVEGTMGKTEVLLIFEILTVAAIGFLFFCWLVSTDRAAIRNELVASLWFLLAALALCAVLRRSRRGSTR